MNNKKLKIIITLIFIVFTLMSCSTQNDEKLSFSSLIEDNGDTNTSAPVDSIQPEPQPTKNIAPVASGQAKHNSSDSNATTSNIDKQIDIKAIPTLNGTVCVFITNNSSTVIDELAVQINYKDASGTIIDLAEDGHDMILPNYTVVSELDAPEKYTDFEVEYNAEVGVHPSYKNHSEECEVVAQEGSDGIIIQITNNSGNEIREIEYIVVFYKGDNIIDASFAQDVYDVKAGETVTEKVSTYSVEDFDRFEVYLNQAHTFE